MYRMDSSVDLAAVGVCLRPLEKRLEVKLVSAWNMPFLEAFTSTPSMSTAF